MRATGICTVAGRASQRGENGRPRGCDGLSGARPADREAPEQLEGDGCRKGDLAVRVVLGSLLETNLGFLRNRTSSQAPFSFENPWDS